MTPVQPQSLSRVTRTDFFMKYLSTRGNIHRLSFEEAVLTGLAPDGGLYIPAEIPSLPPNWQTDWKDYSFIDLSVAVLSLYIDKHEISTSDLRDLVVRSYSDFRDPAITPLQKLDDHKYILELWHGPTWAFKDVALQFLGNLFEFFLKRRNDRGTSPNHRLTVVAATSGDTGSAAIAGLRNKENISMFILHPKGRVSPLQEAQMTTITDQNVHNIAVKGTFDNCQDIVKSLFSDPAFKSKYSLGAVNSINWARILAQMVYYFYAYFHLQKLTSNTSPLLQFVVPTGNFGDILAGYYAKRMGLPMLSKLGVATNANDILARFWASGKYEVIDPDASEATDSSGVKATCSPAMDILVSSNFERLMWYLAYETVGNDAEKASSILSGWMGKMKADGKVEVEVSVLEIARRDFCAERVGDDETLETIRKTFEGSPPYLVDPHTAVGLAAAEKMKIHLPPNTNQIILSTAHPAKFSESVSLALKNSPAFEFERDVMPTELRGLLDKPRRAIDVDRPDVDLIREVIVDKMR